ncbi:MAG TPA: hypothetical protein VFY12_04430, partial [Arenimonas sp.]|nr:hypothetical protein [Arenimonas sp.]
MAKTTLGWRTSPNRQSTGSRLGAVTIKRNRRSRLTVITGLNCFDALLTTLGIEASRRRPRVSNGNVFGAIRGQLDVEIPWAASRGYT